MRLCAGSTGLDPTTAAAEGIVEDVSESQVSVKASMRGYW